jgi:hypothetical protein
VRMVELTASMSVNSTTTPLTSEWHLTRAYRGLGAIERRFRPESRP